MFRKLDYQKIITYDFDIEQREFLNWIHQTVYIPYLPDKLVAVKLSVEAIEKDKCAEQYEKISI